VSLINEFQILVADIGGTNARFGVVNVGSGPEQSNRLKGFIASKQIKLKCADYTTIAAMANEYCKQAEIQMPSYGCLAIAGPIENGWAQMTNLNWAFSIEDMRIELGMKELDVINDFAALAYATPFLQPDEIKLLYAGESDPTAAMVVFGPGTGFGMAALVPDNGRWKLLPTEGGHCSFAPTNSQEIAIRAHIAEDQDHVSIEDLLSGRGLASIYQALAAINGITAHHFSPEQVSVKGMANEDALCRAALETFCNILGSVAGDKALSLGARGGVYLGGGIIPKIASFIPQSKFVERYQHKGPMSDYVRAIPVNMILNDTAALTGTAAWLINKTPELIEQFCSC
jgi:glucokinase